jgi:two-component system OmpR family sensor kinase
VAVAVLLVAVTALLIGAATTVAMRSHLSGQLDDDVRESLYRGFDGGPGGPRDPYDAPGQQLGEIKAVLSDPEQREGRVLAEQDGDSWYAWEPLTADQLDALESLDVDETTTLAVPGLGTYRAYARGDRFDDGTMVAALPLAEVDSTIANLVRLELLATLLGVLAAAGVGTFVVRRQLAPLREVADTAHRVAELPLASGEIDMAERVPRRLTDERTEIGQVGSALNAMLDHVEDSLGRRHRSEQQVRQFVADASHELRTPLATIAGYTELARHRPETSGTALDKVETESARMTALVEDLLLLARLDSGRPLERRPVDLSRLLLEAVDDARVVDAERSWRLSLPDEPITVSGDEARLHQAVSNLLTNARKHTEAGSTVTVTGSSRGFSVHDDGPGFASDLAPRAFERFTRGDAARSRGGAGLGLSLVEAIVAAHGGSVALTSAPGDTTITVVLPSPSPSPSHSSQA